MKLELKAPCEDCPFRNDIRPYLTTERVEEITDSVFYQDKSFSCHKHNEFDDYGGVREGKNSQHCAGVLIMLEKANNPNQMMRIAERLGMYDRTKLNMDAPVDDSPEEMIERMEA